MNIKIKYFEGAKKLEKISKGNWIDVYANKDVFVPVNERKMIPLGFAMELPVGYEAWLLPRSSTFKTWGIIQTNHMGIIDTTFCGDNDQWHMPVYCLQPKDTKDDVYDVIIRDGYGRKVSSHEETCKIEGTWIRKGDKIGQFRITESMPQIEFEEVDNLGNADRGGFGSTGTK